ARVEDARAQIGEDRGVNLYRERLDAHRCTFSNRASLHKRKQSQNVGATTSPRRPCPESRQPGAARRGSRGQRRNVMSRSVFSFLAAVAMGGCGADTSSISSALTSTASSTSSDAGTRGTPSPEDIAACTGKAVGDAC